MIAIAAASTSAIFTAIGVGLGSATTLASQLITTRATGRQARQERVASVRQERKDAILKFLEIAQRVERLGEDRQFDRSIGNPEESTHQMWVMQKSLDLVATAALHDAALAYAIRLNDATYKPLPMDQDVWDFIEKERTPFLNAAGQALDIQTIEGEWRDSRGLRRLLRRLRARRAAHRL